MLTAHGANKIMVENSNKLPVAISFICVIQHKEVAFRLVANHEGVLRALKKDAAVPNNKRTQDHALKVAWRIVRDWVEAQLAMVEAEQSSMLEVFLPYAELPSGNTFYQEAMKNDALRLGQ